MQFSACVCVVFLLVFFFFFFFGGGGGGGAQGNVAQSSMMMRSDVHGKIGLSQIYLLLYTILYETTYYFERYRYFWRKK